MYCVADDGKVASIHDAVIVLNGCDTLNFVKRFFLNSILLPSVKILVGLVKGSRSMTVGGLEQEYPKGLLVRDTSFGYVPSKTLVNLLL